MDKQTLSNYGWVVIVTLILAVMLALATPFGTYVGDAVVSVANGFVGTSNEAIDEDNIKTNNEKWDAKFDYSIFENDTSGTSNCCTMPNVKTYGDDKKCENCGNVTYGDDIHNGIIPEGGIYKRFRIEESYCDICSCPVYGNPPACPEGHIESELITWTEGQPFPQIEAGDLYQYGNYEYCYRYEDCGGCYGWSHFCGCLMEIDGWGVHCVKDIAQPGQIIANINNEFIVDIEGAFSYIFDEDLNIKDTSPENIVGPVLYPCSVNNGEYDESFLQEYHIDGCGH